MTTSHKTAGVLPKDHSTREQQSRPAKSRNNHPNTADKTAGNKAHETKGSKQICKTQKRRKECKMKTTSKSRRGEEARYDYVITDDQASSRSNGSSGRQAVEDLKLSHAEKPRAAVHEEEATAARGINNDGHDPTTCGPRSGGTVEETNQRSKDPWHRQVGELNNNIQCMIRNMYILEQGRLVRCKLRKGGTTGTSGRLERTHI